MRIRVIVSNAFLLSAFVFFFPLFNLSAQESLPFSLDFQNFSFLYTDKGKVVAKFEAKVCLRDKNENITLPQGGKITYYRDDGSIKLIAVAKTATSDKDFLVWQFGGGVEIISDDITLQSQNISWNRKEETLETEDKIFITHKDDKLTGLGLFAKQDLSYYVIKQPAADVITEKK